MSPKSQRDDVVVEHGRHGPTSHRNIDNVIALALTRLVLRLLNEKVDRHSILSLFTRCLLVHNGVSGQFFKRVIPCVDLHLLMLFHKLL